MSEPSKQATKQKRIVKPKAVQEEEAQAKIQYRVKLEPFCKLLARINSRGLRLSGHVAINEAISCVEIDDGSGFRELTPPEASALVQSGFTR